MAPSFLARPDGARPRWRGAITSVMMLLIALLIVRDILPRRWSTTAPAQSDVTRHAP